MADIDVNIKPAEIRITPEPGKALIQIGLTTRGKVMLARRLDFLANDMLADFGYVFDLIEKDYYDTVRKVFEFEGAVDGRRKWAPLSPSYAEEKRKRYPGKKILERTGRLKRSYLQKGAEGNVYERTKTTLKLGSNLKDEKGRPLGARLSMGWVRINKDGSKKRVPGRPILMITEAQRRRWAMAFRHGFMKRWMDNYRNPPSTRL